MQARDERALPALCERRRRVPAQNMPEQGASRSIVPPRTELLCRGTPVAFVEGITPTIHTRPTDSPIDDDLSCSAARSRAYLHVDVCKPVFARSRLLSSSIVVHFAGPTGGPGSVFFFLYSSAFSICVINDIPFIE